MNWSFISAVSYFVYFQYLFFSTIEREKWLKIALADTLSYLFYLQYFVPASNRETLSFREPQWPCWYGDGVEIFTIWSFLH